ncbi:hypothetical protein EMPG_15382 [Blastomyces silverae]|uniref:Uncharacterized protein n=1 Tax=Blastomyces silverae TaxID=2060906 RepID=A0A0H1BCJ4_9EURO|nr:hypothetical protein EMPG_15382 [Blastomyces silverae]
MVSISRFVPSLTAPTVETTLAFANLNFDFSLVKLEAPKEFLGLGNSLSRHRRESAEIGPTHITARKLGALFAQVVPSTPKLEEAYGKRVSEIAGSSDINPQGLRSDGIFADYIGADGTSIWAAATSGSPAISVHLLACMIARVWSAPEAISIWSELVAERKKALGTVNHAEPLGYGDLLASHVQISREQLAEWDNSARAWLRRADQAKKIEQTQVKLILDNITVCVNAKPTTYASTIDAWRSALVGMERLVKGESQNANDGGLLLALSSWHLYPDIAAFGDKFISQHDNIFPKGVILTIGLESSPAQGQRGVYWSLPLAHMKYYGDPVQAHATLSEAATRVTIDEFGVLVLGTIIAGWGASGRNATEAARMIITLHKAVQGQRYPKWLDIVASAACMLVEAKDVDRAVLLKLINLARRRGSSFLCDSNSHPQPLFSLMQFEVFLPLLTDDEDRIDILREYAPAFFPEARADEVIIRYRFKGLLNQQQQQEEEEEEGGEGEKTKLCEPLAVCDTSEKAPTITVSSSSPGRVKTETVITHYATALPRTIKSGQVAQKTHHRWVDERLQGNVFSDSRVNSMESQSNKSKVITLLDMSDYQWQLQQSGGFSAALHERQQETAGSQGSSEKTSPGDNGNDSATKTLTYHHFVGDPNSASLFVISDLYEAYKQASSAPLWARKPNLPKKSLRFDDIRRILERGRVDRKKLAQQLYPAKNNYQLDSEKSQRAKNYDDYFTSLNAVAEVHEVYKALGQGATINPNVISQKLYDAHWVKTMSVWKSVHASREYQFACISYFDTGTVNLPPSKFENVMALSSGDSLYISAPLLCDPSDKVAASNIRHMIGNVGKHGLLLLVPPPVPQVMTPELDNWRSIDHPLYEGQLEDTFRGTTLHLSFTDWSAPIDLGRGHRDAEAYVVESVVSVNDNGRWIADLDVLDSLKNGCGQFDHKFFFKSGCAHTPSSTATTATQNATVGDFVDKEISCITNWDEFLERPDTPSVAMTHNNWLARLSIAVIAIRRGDRVFVNDRFCIQCLEDLEAFDPALPAKVLFVV